jgi:peroxiredoxin
MKVKIHSLIIVCWLTLLYTAVAFAAQEGTQAPGFNLRDLKGNVVTLEHYKGKVVLLVFWAPWCASCRVDLPELEQLYNKYQDEGFAVIGINVDASTARVAAFLRKAPLKYAILVDSKGETAEAYRLSGLPTIFIIDREGVVKHRHSGYEKEFLGIYDKEIQELLNQASSKARTQ